jgi:hypothetical protein
MKTTGECFSSSIMHFPPGAPPIITDITDQAHNITSWMPKPTESGEIPALKPRNLACVRRQLFPIRGGAVKSSQDEKPGTAVGGRGRPP